MSSLLDQAAADNSGAQWWDPDIGDSIEGTITGITVFNGDFSDFPVYTVDTGDGVFRVGASRTVLRGKLEEKNAERGDQVAIIYNGIPDGVDYHHYGVAVKKTTLANTARGDSY